jgi:hypothetical protein
LGMLAPAFGSAFREKSATLLLFWTPAQPDMILRRSSALIQNLNVNSIDLFKNRNSEVVTIISRSNI